MSRNNRTIVIALAALAAAISGFLLLQPGDDENSSSATTTVVTTTAMGAAGALTTTATTTAPEPGPERTAIRLKGGDPVGGKQKISVSKGDTVRLTVSSDTPDEVHVHGYDLEEESKPGSPATFRFTADIEGRFEIESHTTETQIAELTVNP